MGLVCEGSIDSTYSTNEVGRPRRWWRHHGFPCFLPGPIRSALWNYGTIHWIGFSWENLTRKPWVSTINGGFTVHFPLNQSNEQLLATLHSLVMSVLVIGMLTWTRARFSTAWDFLKISASKAPKVHWLILSLLITLPFWIIFVYPIFEDNLKWVYCGMNQNCLAQNWRRVVLGMTSPSAVSHCGKPTYPLVNCNIAMENNHF